MSDLQKSFVKSRLAKLPPDIPLFEEDEEQQLNHDGSSDGRKIGSIAEEDGDSSSSSASSTGTVVPSPSQRLFARPGSWVFFNPLKIYTLCSSISNKKQAGNISKRPQQVPKLDRFLCARALSRGRRRGLARSSPRLHHSTDKLRSIVRGTPRRWVFGPLVCRLRYRDTKSASGGRDIVDRCPPSWKYNCGAA